MRHVFSIVPAILALAGSLMVLVLQSSSLCCSTVREGWYILKPFLFLQKNTRLNTLRFKWLERFVTDVALVNSPYETVK